jgi:hypothetical protein
LCIGEIGFVGGDIHRLDCGCADSVDQSTQARCQHNSSFLSKYFTLYPPHA